MAYEIQKTYYTFGDGISDDPDIGTNNAVSSLDSIDVQSSNRYTKIEEVYGVKSHDVNYTGIENATWAKETQSGIIISTNTATLFNSSAVTISPATASYGIDTYGSGSSAVNYMFLNDRVRIFNYDCSTTSSDITTNYPGLTANTVTGFHVTNLLFSKGDKIYFIDTVNNYINQTSISTVVGATNGSTTITTNDTTGWTRGASVTGTGFAAGTTIVSIISNTSAVISAAYTGTTGNAAIKIGRDCNATQLMLGSTVKLIYSYSYDSTVVVATNQGNTYIYELDFTGAGYGIVRKIEIKGYECLNAVGNGFDVFWISNEGIHQYQGGQSQFIKKVSLYGATSVVYNKKLRILIPNSTVYEYGAISPGARSILTRSVQSFNFLIQTHGIVLSSNNYKAYLKGGYKLENTIELLPLDGGAYEITKADLNYKFGYIFPKYSSAGYDTPRCSIIIKIQTDEIERTNSSTWVTVGTYQSDSLGYIEITPTEVANALSTAGYSAEFGYVRTRIILTAGDAQTGTATGFYGVTPKLYDFTIFANYVKR